MNIREQLHKVRYGPICNIGGDKKQSTSNTAQNYDNRVMNTDSFNTYDLSNRSVNYTTTTDGGAVAGALNTVKEVIGFAQGVASGQQAATIHAYDYAGGLFDTSLDAVNKNNSRAYDAFDRAAMIQRDALTMSGAANREALAMVQNAYADAKGTTQSQQQVMLGVLAVAAVAVIASKG